MVNVDVVFCVGSSHSNCYTSKLFHVGRQNIDRICQILDFSHETAIFNKITMFRCPSLLRVTDKSQRFASIKWYTAIWYNNSSVEC